MSQYEIKSTRQVIPKDRSHILFFDEYAEGWEVAWVESGSLFYNDGNHEMAEEPTFWCELPSKPEGEP